MISESLLNMIEVHQLYNPPKQLVLYFQWSLYLPYASMQTVCQYEPPTIARCASFTMAAHRYPGCQQCFGSLAFAVDEDLKDHSDIHLLLINQKWDFCGSFGLPALKIRNFLSQQSVQYTFVLNQSRKRFWKKTILCWPSRGESLKWTSQNVFANQTKNVLRSQKLFYWLAYLPQRTPPQKQGEGRLTMYYMYILCSFFVPRLSVHVFADKFSHWLSSQGQPEQHAFPLEEPGSVFRPKGKDRLPTTIFPGLAVSFKECTIYLSLHVSMY